MHTGILPYCMQECREKGAEGYFQTSKQRKRAAASGQAAAPEPVRILKLSSENSEVSKRLFSKRPVRYPV